MLEESILGDHFFGLHVNLQENSKELKAGKAAHTNCDAGLGKYSERQQMGRFTSVSFLEGRPTGT